MDLTVELNPPQREAVESTEGPLLILAGAGSGKTRVITYRIAYLIRQCGIPPWNILAVTFTNKAAGEMKRRVEDLLGEHLPDLHISTFHSLCACILRRHADRIGYPRDFSVYDDQDTKQLLKKIIKESNLPARQFTPGALRNKISEAKDKLQEPEDTARTAFDYFTKEAAKIYDIYQQELRRIGALDFDDLIMQTVRLLESVDDVREQLQQRFVYVMVDEYQDTNFAQYRLVQLLAEPQQNLCVVGDDDQSIYTWRGADIRNILEFEKDHPTTKTVMLEQNYRSTPTILNAAYVVVCGNYRRKNKKLWTERPEGEKITVLLTQSDAAEADLVASRIKGFRDTFDYSLSECAVLYRTNAQSRAFEEAMRRYALPYVLVGGVKFFQRKEVKDVLAYAHLVANPRDVVAFRRVINYPKRGLGTTTQAKLEDATRQDGRPIMELLMDQDAVGTVLSPRAAKQVAKFAGLIAEMREAKDKLNLGDWTRRLVDRLAIRDELESDDPTQSAVRIENVDELIAGAAEYSMTNPEATLEQYLEETALVTDVDRWDPDTEAVTLMTLHSAKGLEFPVVYMAGLEEGLFPLSQAMEDPEKLAEERRLFYVGSTRAKERLFMSYARTRRRFGDVVNIQSRFLSELPKDAVEIENHIGYDALGPGGLSYDHPRTRTVRRRAATGSTAFHESDEQPGNDIAAVLQAGTRVIHPVFGEGMVEAVSGHGNNLSCRVAFKTGETKTIIARYANFEIVSF